MNSKIAYLKAWANYYTVSFVTYGLCVLACMAIFFTSATVERPIVYSENGVIFTPTQYDRRDVVYSNVVGEVVTPIDDWTSGSGNVGIGYQSFQQGVGEHYVVIGDHDHSALEGSEVDDE